LATIHWRMPDFTKGSRPGKPSPKTLLFGKKISTKIQKKHYASHDFGWGGGRFVICSCSLSGSPSLEDSSFARTWVSPSCTFFFPFVGCFVFLMIGRFSSFCNGHSSQKQFIF
jgi:hypothetical protein